MPNENANRRNVYRRPLYRAPREIIEHLISIGRAVAAHREPPAHSILAVKEHDEINRMRSGSFASPKRMELPITEMSNEDLASFTLGISYAESHYRWIGGSAASAINLLQVLEDRDYPIEKLDELCEFLRVHGDRHNPYKPHGSQLTRFFNLSQYRLYADSVAAEYEQRQIEQDKRTIENASEEARLKAMARLGHRDRNTDRRKKIIGMFNQMSMPEQIRYMAEHPIYPPQFFPIRIAYAATEKDMADLPDELALELWRRIKRYRRGPWRNFKDEVASRVAKILLTGEADTCRHNTY